MSNQGRQKQNTGVEASALMNLLPSNILEIVLVFLMKCIGLTLYSSFRNLERQNKWLETIACGTLS